MSDQEQLASDGPETPEVILPVAHEGGDPGSDAEAETESVSSPAKVMRIGSMIKQLLDEVRAASLDEKGRERLKSIFEESVTQLSETLSPDLAEELASLAPPFDEGTPSEAELRVAQAQLVGWLEGLFHGIQATLFAQQMAARQQLEQIRGQLGPGQMGGPQAAGAVADGADTRPGTYL